MQNPAELHTEREREGPINGHDLGLEDPKSLETQTSHDSGYKSSELNTLEASGKTTTDEFPSTPNSPPLNIPALTTKSFLKVGEGSYVVPEAFNQSEDVTNGNRTSPHPNVEPDASVRKETTATLQENQASFQETQENLVSLAMVTGKEAQVQPISLGTDHRVLTDKDTVIREQRNEIGTLKIQLTKAKQEKKHLQDELEQVMQKKIDLEVDLEHVKRDCELELRSRDGELKRVTQEYNDCKQQLAGKELEMEDMKNELSEALEKAKAEAEEKIRCLVAENETRLKELKKLKAKEEETEKEKYKVEAELAQTREKCNEKISKLMLELQQKEIELLKKEKELMEKENRIKELEAHIAVEELRKTKERELQEASRKYEELRRNSDENIKKERAKNALLAKQVAELESANKQRLKSAQQDDYM